VTTPEPAPPAPALRSPSSGGEGGAWPSKWRRWVETYRRPLIIVAAHLALFTLARVALLLRYPGDFSSLRGGAVAGAFLRGLRYDLSVLCPLLGVPLLMLLLPFARTRTRPWQTGWSWVAFAVFVAFAFLLAGDVVYFGYVHRHAGPEVTALDDALNEMQGSFLFYLLPIVVFAAAAGGLGWGWRRVLKAAPPAPVHFGAQLAIAAAALILLYYGERGTLSGKRLRIVHAFQNQPEAAAHLSLNGPYSLLRSLTHARVVRADFYPWSDAVRTAQETLFTAGDRTVDPEYPMLRGRDPAPSEKPNVVVIMLESWDAFWVDAHRRELGLDPIGTTPCYDAIAREGILFPRFYASGQRSMDGLSAMLCGFPSLPGTSYLGRGLEQSTLSGLGHLGRREGYETWFIMAAERNAFRIDAIAGLTGFDHYVAAEDIPPEAPAAPRTDLRGACWDHEMFAEAGRKLAAAKRPFLAYLYTSATHPPFCWPDDRWKKRPGNALEDRYHNSLAYADWALGQFFERARTQEWFRKTVFLITADHIGGPGGGISIERPWTKHHVPCAVLAPGLKPGVDRRIGGQLDVIPTVAALAGWASPHAALGTSLLSDPPAGRGALCVEGNLVIRVEDGGFVVHDLSGRVTATGDAADAIERRLLSTVQTAYTLLRTNRIAKKP
jgi:phosphoglycerol transferase MdoB-like AlkP superfamily enzyme